MTRSFPVNTWQFVKNNIVRTFAPPCQSVLQRIESYSQTHPDKEAIVGVSESGRQPLVLSYQALAHALQQSRDFFIHTLALTAGDTISVLMQNNPDLLAISWAAWSTGLKTAPLDGKRDSLERKLYKLQLTRAKVLFVRIDKVDLNEISRIRQELPSLRIIELVSETHYFDMVGQSRESTGHDSGKDGLSERVHDLDSDCLILFTSGTTSLPKGVRLTPRSLWANAAQIIHWLKITEQDRFHILLPLHHINSTTFSLATILAGATIVLSPRYSKSGFWQTMAASRATLSSIVPTIAYDLLSEQPAFEENKDKLRQVSRIQLGSAPVQPGVVMRFYSQYGIPLIQGYGSTETSLRCTGVPYALCKDDYLKIVRSNSIGTEMLYDNVAVLDEHCREKAEGTEGEICVRGPIVMQGYLHDDKETKKAFRGGWLHSGDLGYWEHVNGRKMFFIKGRLKEIIIKGGVNISPLAVENAVLKAIPELDFCYAVGFPHPRLGEEIGLVADGKPSGLDALRQSLRARRIHGLQPYECPAAFIAVKREDLPTTSTGKIQRVKTRELYADKLFSAFQNLQQENQRDRQ